MAKYLLDTNICISIIKNRYGLIKKIESIGEHNCAVSEITIAELFYGAAKSGNSKHYNDVKNILDIFDVVPVYPSLKLFGEIKAALEKKGQRLDNFDLMIGATAIHENMIMVTSNTKHFERMPGIILEDWCESNDYPMLLNEAEMEYHLHPKQ